MTYFVNNHFITFKDLNEFVLNNGYGYSELKDKPMFVCADDLKSPRENLGQTVA